MQTLIRGLGLNENITEDWILNNCYIAGGACVSHVTRQKINDVDLYFKTKKARDYFINELYSRRFDDGCYIGKNSRQWKALIKLEKLVKKGLKLGDEIFLDELNYSVGIDKNHENILFYWIQEAKEVVNGKPTSNFDCIELPVELFNKQKWMFGNGYDYVLMNRNHFEVDGSNTFLGNKSVTIKFNDLFYQFIIRFYGEPRKVMNETFDFQHCKIAFDLNTRKYIATDDTWHAITSKTILYVNSFYPISSLKRLYKYASRGFTYNTDTFVKIIKDIHKVDVDNKFVIEDQLIGYYEDFDYNIVFDQASSNDFAEDIPF